MQTNTRNIADKRHCVNLERSVRSQKLPEQLAKFPVVAIVGPRQSGKTTLAKSVAHDYA
ncbi:MAG: hypothetical protein ACOCXT_01350 [Candidatus Dojkabacteria bacterium]